MTSDPLFYTTDLDMVAFLVCRGLEYLGFRCEKGNGVVDVVFSNDEKLWKHIREWAGDEEERLVDAKDFTKRRHFIYKNIKAYLASHKSYQ